MPRLLPRRKVAGRAHPPPCDHAALHAELAHAQVALRIAEQDLTAEREHTRVLRAALALAPFAQRAALWFPLLAVWRLV